MSLKPFGARVTALDVERVPEDTGPTHFVRVCGALIRWALVEHGAPSADIQISERLNVPDRGVDAECTLPADMIETGGFVGPGRTIFQFKYRSDRHVNISALAGRLRDELARLPVDCDRYVLMTNINLAGTQTSRLRKAILAGAPALATRPVIVWGASEIANALNASQGLRHLFAAAGGLSTVEVAEDELKAAYRSIGWAPLVNRARELSSLREFIESDTGGVLVVRGPQFSGRTRLVLEALKQSAPRALWAVMAEHVDIDLLRDLDSSSRNEVIVVDDDRDDAAIRRILDWAEQRERLKVIVIARGEPRQPEIHVPAQLDVHPLERSDADALLRTLAPALAWGDRSWILDGSDGLPGLVAHAAALLPGERPSKGASPGEFRRRLGDLLTERYEAALSPGQRQALQVVALLPAIGVEDLVGSQVSAVAKALDLDPALFPAHRLALERAGLIRRRGRFIQVVPPLLAEHIAARALTHPERVIAELELVLTDARFLFLSFLERLARLPGETAQRAIERLLQERCSGFETLLCNIDLIRALAPGAPAAAMRCIEQALSDRTAESLGRMEGDARRSLVGTLEELAHQSVTFESAAIHLLRLAEAETGSTDQEPATGRFLSLFQWWHPELPVSLSQRLAVLERGAGCNGPRPRWIVAEACGVAFQEGGALPVHHPRGPHLPEPASPPRTWDELASYGFGVLLVLQRLLRDDDGRVRTAAASSASACFRSLIVLSLRLRRTAEGAPPELALKAIEVLAEVAASTESARAHQNVATALELALATLGAAAPDHPYAQEVLRKTRAVHSGLTSSFRGQLWRLVGPASWDQRRLWLRRPIERQAAIRDIASKFIADSNYPALFDFHADWLMGPEARAGDELFHVLGATDARRELWRRLLARDAQTAVSEARLSAYLSGWAQSECEMARIEVDHLIASRPDLTAVLLNVLATLFNGRDLVARVGRLLEAGALERHEFATRLTSAMPWEQLHVSDTAALLTTVDDGSSAMRNSLLLAFTIRLHRRGEFSEDLREMAWSFLKASASLQVASSQSWWDELGAKLGETEPQKLLEVVETLALCKTRTEHGGLDPYFDIPLTLDVLRKADRQGLIRMLLTLASRPEATWRIGTTLREEIDPVVDREILLAFAREEGLEGARTVALDLTPEKSGFWAIARDLLAEWGQDDRLQRRLLASLYGSEGARSPLPVIVERLNKATSLRSDPNPRVASWAQEAVSLLEDWRRREGRKEQEDWIWDYRIPPAELEGMVRGPDSPDKLWAIGRLLEHAPRERVLELLTPEQILEALDKLSQLPERKREQWEAWAKHWAGHH